MGCEMGRIRPTNVFERAGEPDDAASLVDLFLRQPVPEIVDAIFVVAIPPASQGQPEAVQRVGHGLRLRGSDTAVTHVVSGVHSPRPFSRTTTGTVDEL